MKDKDFPFRYIDLRGARYLRLEDVAAFLRELGSTEATDVRNRLDETARRITSEMTP